MPQPTAFHPRTSALCHSHEWREWAGWLAASTYEHSHEREYYAIRNGVALIDVSPLFKYEVRGPDAVRLVNRVMTRDIGKCQVGRVMYTPWCDDDGKMIEDGTVARLADDHLRVTAAERSLRWFEDCGYGLDASVDEVTEELAALAVQGPNSRALLQELMPHAGLDKLSYFRLTKGKIDGFEVTVTRTGYTGDLGYELWTPIANAPQLWDSLMDKGNGYGATPTGIVALDIARIEAGLLLIDVDFFSSHKTLIEAQKSSPLELGLGWAVRFDKGDYVGRQALLDEEERGSEWALMGVEVDWVHLERLFDEVDLPPRVAGRASRSAVPLYKEREQIGQVTSHTFSPILKKYIGLASLRSLYARPGNQVEMEVTIEYSRQRARATLVKPPFFDPRRKKE